MRRFYGWFGIAALALLVRALFLAEFAETVAFRSPVVDAYTYDQQARSVAAGGPGALELPYYQPPLYSLVLGGIYAVAPGPWGPRLVQAGLGVLTSVLVGLVAARVGGRRAGYVGGGLFALYGPALWMEGELLPPTLVLTTTTAAIWLLDRADRAERPLRALLGAGVLLGVASAARPTSILFGALAGLWWALGGSRSTGGGAGRPSRLASAIAFGLAIALPILPFTIANRVGGGENVVVSYNGGINFYLGNGANSDSLTAIQPGHHWDKLQIAPWAAGVRSRVGESNYWFERGLREAAADPAAWVRALGRKIVRLLDARETPRNTDFEVARRESRVLSAPLPGFALVAPLALLGLWLGFANPSSRRLRSLLILLLIAVAIENLAFFVAARYRLEATPALCVLAGLGVDAAIRSRGRPVLALVAAAGLAGFVLVDWLGERPIDEARAAINRSVALQRAGFEASAARALEDALRADPRDVDAHRLLAESLVRDHQPEAALRELDAALALAPDYVQVLLVKGRLLEQIGRADEAGEPYRRAVQADPFEKQARSAYGVWLAIRHRYEEARVQFEAGLAIDPTDSDLRHNLGNLERVQRGS